MKNKRSLKKILAPILVPATKKYLQQERRTHFLGLTLLIPSGIFHPAFFFSTKTMGKFISRQHIVNQKILEIGCGSGAISILAAKKGGSVFCSDINQAAVEATLYNAGLNGVSLQAMRADLFDSIHEVGFDLILNNPPYYPKDPVSIEEHAFYAGKDLSYFNRLFRDSKKYLAKNGMILLVLTDDCDLEKIHSIASGEGFVNEVVYTRPTLLEKTYIIAYKTPI